MTLYSDLSWQHFLVRLHDYISYLNYTFLICVCSKFTCIFLHFICYLVGPCALEYTKLKTSDHFWTDPSANELVQRHRIHGAQRGQEASPSRRPALGVRERQSSMRGVDRWKGEEKIVMILLILISN